MPTNVREYPFPENSFPGAKVPTGNFRSEERKYREANNVLIPLLSAGVHPSVRRSISDIIIKMAKDIVIA